MHGSRNVKFDCLSVLYGPPVPHMLLASVHRRTVNAFKAISTYNVMVQGKN